MPHRFVVFAFVCLWFTSRTLRADEIAGRVLLPDGKWAEGVKVTARQFLNTRDGLQTTETTGPTDDMGIFRMTVPRIEYTAGSRSHNPYVLFDLPGCALCIAFVSAKVPGELYKDIRLSRDVPVKGIVRGPDNKPAKGVRVMVKSWSFGFGFGGWVLNRENAVATPQLITTTNAKGEFTLRSVEVRDYSENFRFSGDVTTIGNLTAEADINGRKLEGESGWAVPFGSAPTALSRPIVIKLKPVAKTPT